MKRAALFDIDGVLADASARFATLQEGRYLPDGREVMGWIPDWERFHDERMDADPVDQGWRAVTNTLYLQSDIEVILLTNRQEVYRARTERWLERGEIFYDKLLMRDRSHYDHAKAAHIDALLRSGCHIEFGVDDDALHREVYESRRIPFIHAYNRFAVPVDLPGDKEA